MVKKYFAGANTAQGYTNLLENNLAGIENIYAISGRSKRQKSEILSVILKKAEEKYIEIESIISPFDIADISGVIIRDTKTAIIDNDVYQGEKPVKIIEIERKNIKNNSVIEKILSKEAFAFNGLYDAYQKGKEIHDEWEKIYIDNMDYSRLEAYEKGIIRELLGDNQDKSGTQNYKRFFGASTPDGSVNYIDNLTEYLSARYFIKGRPGTGKSTFLKRLTKEANARGFDTEVYYCSFDKNSLDMVIVPKLSFCVFDSTAPHEMFPEDKRDSILDFYEESGLSGVDEKYEKQLLDVAERYRQKVAEGMAFLRLGKLYMREKEYYFEKEKDEKKIALAKEKLLSELF